MCVVGVLETLNVRIIVLTLSVLCVCLSHPLILEITDNCCLKYELTQNENLRNFIVFFFIWAHFEKMLSSQLCVGTTLCRQQRPHSAASCDL